MWGEVEQGGENGDSSRGKRKALTIALSSGAGSSRMGKKVIEAGGTRGKGLTVEMHEKREGTYSCDA
jgi:hypothetical protein